MRILAGAPLLLLSCGLLAGQPPAAEKLVFDVEWRLIHAGIATLESRKGQSSLKLESAGIVSRLYKIEDQYTANYDEQNCVTSSLLDAMEGKRHNETRITYDRAQKHAFFVERDLLKNEVVRETGVDIPACVTDVLGGLTKMRTLNLDPGQSAPVPTSDGRRAANVKIEAQEREQVKTDAGTFKTMRYEAYLLNGVVYSRKGHAQIWISDDPRHMPVQIRLRMSFPLGTVTLRLMDAPVKPTTLGKASQ